MRLGVLDVGSNTVHLLVVDAHQGARPLPAFSHKEELHLADHLDAANRLSGECAVRLLEFIREAIVIAEDKGVQELVAFATSAIRDAANGDEILAWIEAETQVKISVLPGTEESRLTFLAARRWFGWSSGRLLLLDIGGGSLEIASGQDEDPSVAVSLPLGANRLTRYWLDGDPPDRDEVRRLRKHVRAEIAAAASAIRSAGEPDHCVATSKTFRQLARIAGAAPSSDGVYVKRILRHGRRRRAGRAAAPRWRSRSGRRCPGYPGSGRRSSRRARSSPTRRWTCSSCSELEICPWALREGVILRRMDSLGGLVDAARPDRGCEPGLVRVRVVVSAGSCAVSPATGGQLVSCAVVAAICGQRAVSSRPRAGFGPGCLAPSGSASRRGVERAGSGDPAGRVGCGRCGSAGHRPTAPSWPVSGSVRARRAGRRAARMTAARRAIRARPGPAQCPGDLVFERAAGGLARDQAGDDVPDLGEPPDRLGVPRDQQVQPSLGAFVDRGRPRGRVVELLLGLRDRGRDRAVGVLGGVGDRLLGALLSRRDQAVGLGPGRGDRAL